MTYPIYTGPLSSRADRALLKKIFSYIEIPISTLEEANDFAQKNFLLNDWDLPIENDLYHKLSRNKIALLKDLHSMAMIGALEPKKKEYTYAIVMGSFKEDVIQRFDFLAQLINNGYFFENIVLLSGLRYLEQNEKDGLPDDIMTEMQMMEHLYEEYPAFKHSQALPIDEPQVQNNDGSITRPTTDSTLIYFSLVAPNPGSCLLISNNPYIIRQTYVAQRILNQVDFPTEGAGPALRDDALTIAQLMDEFARRLYEEMKRSC